MFLDLPTSTELADALFLEWRLIMGFLGLRLLNDFLYLNHLIVGDSFDVGNILHLILLKKKNKNT